MIYDKATVYDHSENEYQGKRADQVSYSQTTSFFCLIGFVLVVLVTFIIEKLIQYFN